MPMYSVKWCPRCKAVLETGPDQRGIAPPIAICGNCGQHIIDETNTEWQLKSPVGKLWYMFLSIFTAALLGILVPMVGVALKFLGDVKFNAEKHFILLWAAGSLVILLWLIYKTVSEVNESNERMKDEKYRQKLKEVGLLDR